MGRRRTVRMAMASSTSMYSYVTEFLYGRVTAFLWGGKDVIPARLRGTVNSAFIHVRAHALLTSLHVMLVGIVIRV